MTNQPNDDLRKFVERIENLEEENRGIAEDIKEVYAAAKATGYDAKIMRQVIAERRKPAHERQEQMSLFDVYWHQLEG